MRKNEDAFNVQLDISAVFVVWLPMKLKRMADNGWMYSGRVSVTTRPEEWIWKTQMLVKELARGRKGIPALCPCNRCNKRHRHRQDDMYKHLTRNGYILDYVTTVNFAQRDRDRSEVMRQRLNGNEYDGIRDLINDLVDAEQPDSPPPEPEEPEPTAKAYYAMIEAAKKPLYRIRQCLSSMPSLSV